MAASFVANLIRYQQEGFRPDRDIIVALEVDEEILDRDALGIQWLIKNHRDLIDAEFALNEGGSVGVKRGRPIRNAIQTSEKISVSYRLEVTNKGGHSSIPSPDNAIYHLAEGIARLAKFNQSAALASTTSRCASSRIGLRKPVPRKRATTLPLRGAGLNTCRSAPPNPAAESCAAMASAARPVSPVSVTVLTSTSSL
jgi:acetylornithine deacetylase/succinyl-diaminopimelate desuccinylase-like protein